METIMSRRLCFALDLVNDPALIATWVVLPALPQFDDPSEFVPVRYAPDAAAGWTAVLGLGLLLVGIGLVVAALQLRTGRPDRLREGVR